MSTECSWVESRLEDLFSQDPEVRRAIDSHVASCADCRRQIESDSELDRLLSACMALRMRRAETHQSGSGTARFLAVAAAVAAVAIAVWIGIGSNPPNASPPPAATAGLESGPEEGIQAPLAKPTDTIPAPEPDPGARTPAPLEDASFYVVDAAGYGYSLSDFRGSVVVLGVFDETEANRQDFGQLYQRVPAQANLTFLPVGFRATLPEEAVGLPLMANSGSSLLGTTVGEFAVLTRQGEVYRRGLMSDPGFEEIVRASLRELELDPGE